VTPDNSARSDARKTNNPVENALRLREAYQTVFSKENPATEVVINHLFKIGFVTSTTFVAGDPYQTALNEGARRLVLSMIRYINRNPKDLIEQIEQIYANP